MDRLTWTGFLNQQALYPHSESVKFLIKIGGQYPSVMIERLGHWLKDGRLEQSTHDYLVRKVDALVAKKEAAKCSRFTPDTQVWQTLDGGGHMSRTFKDSAYNTTGDAKGEER
jgi:hypothetical protein